MKADLVIKEVTIVDGIQSHPYVGNVAVVGDSIIHTSRDPYPGDTHRVIDGKGKYLIPGVIDVHSHSDLLHLQKAPFTHKIKMGVTTEIVGNCGIGTFPCNCSFSPLSLDNDVLGDTTSFHSFKEYKEAFLSAPPSNNIASLQAHSPLRTAVMHHDIHRPATPKEIQEMVHLLELSYEMGASGFSTGLYYDPCLYASKQELLALLHLTARYGKIFCVHHRREGDGIVDSVNEVIQLAKESKVRLQISHLKAIGTRNQQHVPHILSMISKAAEEGLDIHFDQYPYEWGSTSLESLLPPSILALNRSDREALLVDKDNWKDVIWEIEHPNGFDSIISLCSFDQISLLSYEADRTLENKTIAEIASMWGMDQYEAFFNLIVLSKGSALMSDVTQTRESLEMIMSHPLGMFCTDSIYSGQNFHPRSTRAVTDLFDRFYIERQVLSLPEHIRRMSSLPSQVFNLGKRGKITPGYKGDLVLLNLPTKGGGASNVETVIINGKVAYEKTHIMEDYPTCFL